MKTEISPGVTIPLTEKETYLLGQLSKTGKLIHDNLKPDQVCVILNLLDKSVLMRKKKGHYVYYKLRPGIHFSTD